MQCQQGTNENKTGKKMGASYSTSGVVIRNGDWEHRLCWSESKSSLSAESLKNGCNNNDSSGITNGAESIAHANSTQCFTSSAQIHSSTHEKHEHSNHGTVQKSAPRRATAQLKYNSSMTEAQKARISQLGSQNNAKEMQNMRYSQDSQQTNIHEQSPSSPAPSQSDVERRLSGREDSDYWSSPSPSIQYFKGAKDEESQVLYYDNSNENRHRSSISNFPENLRRSFNKYTGTVIRAPIDRINRVTPPRRLLRNDSSGDTVDSRKNQNIGEEDNGMEMTNMHCGEGSQGSVETCSTTASVSILI